MSVAVLSDAEAEPVRESVSIETITPIEATRLLDKIATLQRRPLKSVQARYAKDMRAGRWLLSGSSIVIGADHKVYDGQNRLWACKLSQAPFTTIVLRGADPAAFSVMDIGRKRTLSDYLAILGVKYAVPVAAATRLMYLYDKSLALSQGAAHVRATEVELQEVFNRHRGLESAADATCRRKDLLAVIPARIAVFGFYVTSSIDQPGAELFFEIVETGAVGGNGVGITHPAWRLRELLLSRASQHQRPFSQAEQGALLIAAWNLFRQGKEIKRLRYLHKRGQFPKAE